METRHTFRALDGLRGVAAVAVLLYHAHDLFVDGPLFPGSYLAVDVFFVLSGFVLSHAYDRRLRSGIGTLGFMRLRVERLYPAYAVGLAIAAAAYAAAIAQGSQVLPSWAALAASVLFAAGFVPTPAALSGSGSFYPMNPAAWSIGYELLANIAFAACFVWLRGFWLRLLIAAAAVAVTAQAFMHGSLDVGNGWDSAWGGLARVTFSFFVGVALHRVFDAAVVRGPRGPVAAAVLCGVALLTFVWNPAPSVRVFHDVACVLVVFPILIMTAARLHTGPRLSRVCDELGALSYPLYILHTPLLFLLTGILVRVFHLPVAAMRPWGGVLVVGAVLVLSFVVQRCIERPVLDWLKDRRRTGSVGNGRSTVAAARGR